MTALRLACKAATYGTYAWLGWKLATLDDEVRDLRDQVVVHDDLLDDAYRAAMNAEPVAS